MTFDLQTCGHGNVAIQLHFYLCIHADSFNIANLAYNDQSRTLTCTSTGGSPTTVRILSRILSLVGGEVV